MRPHRPAAREGRAAWASRTTRWTTSTTTPTWRFRAGSPRTQGRTTAPTARCGAPTTSSTRAFRRFAPLYCDVVDTAVAENLAQQRVLAPHHRKRPDRSARPAGAPISTRPTSRRAGSPTARARIRRTTRHKPGNANGQEYVGSEDDAFGVTGTRATILGHFSLP